MTQNEPSSGHVGYRIKGRLAGQRTHSLRQDWKRKRIKMQGGLCALCQKPLRLKDDCPSHPLAATIDHIIPLSKGGSDHWENVQVVHRRCNEAKGNA